MVKNLLTIQETWFQSLGWKDPLEKGVATHSGVLTWKTYGQRSVVGYGPKGVAKILDMTERQAHTYITIWYVTSKTFQSRMKRIFTQQMVFQDLESQPGKKITFPPVLLLKVSSRQDEFNVKTMKSLNY